MKKVVFSLAVLFSIMTLNAQVTSTIVALGPDTKSSSDGPTWNFSDGFAITNASGKGYGEFTPGMYSNDGDTVRESTLKMSRQVNFKIVIPDGKTVVRIDFKGFSNSSAVKNWDFLSYLDNGGPTYMVYKEEGVPYNTLVNDDITSKCKYPLSPLAKDYGVFASFIEPKGWFSELNFLIDGNNQAGIRINLYVVDEKDIDNYVLANDATMTALDKVFMPSNENAPAYNLLGQPVGDGYKGIVIKNGKKYLTK